MLEDIPELNSALKHAGHIAGELTAYPMPACADPKGYWTKMLGYLQAAGRTGSGCWPLALTSVAVIAFFARGRRGETAWTTVVAPVIAAIFLTAIVVLAVQHYAGLLGVPPGDPAAWVLPASYGVVAVLGLGWGLILKARRPDIYAAIGLGAHAVTGRLTAFSQDKDVTR